MAPSGDSLSAKSLAANDRGRVARVAPAGRNPIRTRSQRRQSGLRLADRVLTIMTDPLNAYEIVGVLREIFGVSDHDLAVFSEGNGSRFRIDEVIPTAGKISSQLRVLAEIRQRAEDRALFDAVNLIVKETQFRERLLVVARVGIRQSRPRTRRASRSVCGSGSEWNDPGGIRASIARRV